jgi:hypothetical protein
MQILSPNLLALDLMVELFDFGGKLSADILTQLLRGLAEMALIVV